MRIFAIAFFLILSAPVLAQQQDPQIGIYRQLLDQANANLAATIANANTQIAKDQTRIKELEDKYEKKSDPVKK